MEQLLVQEELQEELQEEQEVRLLERLRRELGPFLRFLWNESTWKPNSLEYLRGIVEVLKQNPWLIEGENFDAVPITTFFERFERFVAEEGASLSVLLDFENESTLSLFYTKVIGYEGDYYFPHGDLLFAFANLRSKLECGPFPRFPANMPNTESLIELLSENDEVRCILSVDYDDRQFHDGMDPHRRGMWEGTFVYNYHVRLFVCTPEGEYELHNNGAYTGRPCDLDDDVVLIDSYLDEKNKWFVADFTASEPEDGDALVKSAHRFAAAAPTE